MNCTTCGIQIGSLEAFPGNVCVTCWANSPEGQHIVTAEELITMWGGRP